MGGPQSIVMVMRVGMVMGISITMGMVVLRGVTHNLMVMSMQILMTLPMTLASLITMSEVRIMKMLMRVIMRLFELPPLDSGLTLAAAARGTHLFHL